MWGTHLLLGTSRDNLFRAQPRGDMLSGRNVASGGDANPGFLTTDLLGNQKTQTNAARLRLRK